jgi:hypothetical protein
MSEFTVTGKLILKKSTEQVSDKFCKREFVIEVPNERNAEWNDFIKFQLTQDRCDLIEKASVGSNLTVSFNLRGRKWKEDYFTNLEAWRIQAEEGTDTPSFEEPRGEVDNSSLPF